MHYDTNHTTHAEMHAEKKNNIPAKCLTFFFLTCTAITSLVNIPSSSKLNCINCIYVKLASVFQKCTKILPEISNYNRRELIDSNLRIFYKPAVYMLHKIYTVSAALVLRDGGVWLPPSLGAHSLSLESLDSHPLNCHRLTNTPH